MNLIVANALSGYFEILYEMNQKFILLCGADIMSSSGTKLMFDIIQNIPRMIPFQYDKRISKLALCDKNGLLEFEKEIDFLKDDYCSLLKENYDFIDKARKIRNKCEHKMHAVRDIAASSRDDLFSEYEIEIIYNDRMESVTISYNEFAKLLKQLNLMYSKLQKEVLKFARKEVKEIYLYYRRISRFDFVDFNRIIDSNIIQYIGKVMLDY